MAISKARDIATSIGKAVKADRITSAGLIPSSAAAFSVYDSTVSLPTSDIAVGSQAYISSNQRLYIRGTGGWYNIATVNNTPSINSVQTAAGDSSPFSLATDGSTTTVITINATDSEGFPITFSATTDVGFDSIATVSNDSSVFTITPLSEDSAGTATSGTLTFKASDGVNIASEVATFTLVFRIVNSNFTTTTLKASGNNGTNVTMSGMTVGGDASTQAFSPYHPGGYSYSFDGSGDYIQFPESSDFHFGSGDFTIESWIYLNSASNNHTMIVTRWNTSGGTDQSWLFYVDTATMKLNFSYRDSNGSTYRNNQDTGIIKLTLGQWYHVAVAREGNTFRYFVNGQLSGTVSDSNTVNNGSTALRVGQYSAGGTTRNFDGYIKDLRIVKGTAVYTAAFNPPSSSLTAVTNTKLLTCHLPYISDGSSSNHTYSAVGGDVKSIRFSPYDTNRYNSSSHGSSVYFDGTGDKLTASYDAGYSFGTGDFTIEAWIYPTALSTNRLIIDTYASGENGSYQLYWRATGTSLAFYTVGDGVYLQDSSSGNIILNSWNHVAVSRSGTTARLFVNGKIVDTATNSRDMTHDNALCIGAQNSTSTNYFNGFISDVRIVKGTAVYTAAFTPPALPLSSISGTSILTCDDAPNVFDANGSSSVTLGGTAKSSTAQKKNSSASILFDGNSDYVELSNYDRYAPGTNPFAVEFWMRYTGGSGTRNIVDNRGQANGYAIRLDSSNKITVYSEPSSSTKHTSASALTQDQWYHVAFVRNNGNSSLFIDGTQSGDAAINADNYTSTSMVVGAQHAKNTQYFPGYVEDVRITNDLSRYPFIPAKETLTATADTVLLIGHDSALTNDGTAGGTATASGSAAVSNFGPVSSMKSIYFDGTGDYLTLASNSAYAIGSSDNFSIECWVYFNDFPTGHSPIMQWATNSLSESGTSGASFFGISSSSSGLGSISFNQHGSPNQLVPYANPNEHTFAEREWIHLHVQRIGSTAKSFINGQLAQTTTSSSWSATQNGLYIGARHTPNYMNGYISNLRFIKGATAVNRSDSFTPPAAEL